MNDDNITPLFIGGKASAAAAKPAVAGPKTYNIHLHGDKVIENITGYLGLNGVFVCILGSPNDALDVIFYAQAGDVQYVMESDEVIEA